MEKRFTCMGIGSDCNFVACAKTEEEIFEEAMYHARKVHHVSDFRKEFYEETRSAIRDVPFCYR